MTEITRMYRRMTLDRDRHHHKTETEIRTAKSMIRWIREKESCGIVSQRTAANLMDILISGA